MKRHNWAFALIVAVILLIVGHACGQPGTSPAGNPPPGVSASADTAFPSSADVIATTTGSPVTAPSVSSAASAPPASLAPVSATPVPQPACYPQARSGNCYYPGEYCRDTDHGASGIAGNGDVITCENDNGWRWEPALPGKKVNSESLRQGGPGLHFHPSE